MTKARLLGITEFPYREYDSNNNVTYWEDSDGLWSRVEYDYNSNQTYVEDSDGWWIKKEYNSNGRVTSYYDSTGHWYSKEYDSNGNMIYFNNTVDDWTKYEYDSNGNEIYFENSFGQWSIKNKYGNILTSTVETLNYPEYCKLTYTHWDDEMIIKHEHHIDWLMISFLATLSKNIIDKYSDRLDLNIVKFFNKNLN